ncbi:putative immunity protein [Pseudonocardia phyllosphaerae]|uniref:putative immunity protein n=1 Tax=Pseudonocardia phyllosphaerae TaxID=3390502 RepID=UPI00397CB93B
MDDLRVATRYVLDSAGPLPPLFEAAVPDDERPRAAIDAARAFVDGEARSRRQRVTSLAAHRAATAAPTESARHAAQAAGDAAAAAYLHPPEQVRGWDSAIARETQIGHVLRAPALAARIAELAADGDRDVGEQSIAEAFRRASPQLVALVRRYPPIRPGRSRVAELMTLLDALFRGGA